MQSATPPEIVCNICEEYWKDLILGLQEKLNLGQIELLYEAGLSKDYHVSDWVNGKRIPTQTKKIKILNLAKQLGFSYSDLISFGKRVRQSIKVNGKWVSINKAHRLLGFNGEVLINKNNQIFLNTLCLFPREYQGKSIFYLERGSNLTIFYPAKRSTRPTPLILPKYIKLNKNFLVSWGIYIGEGSRNRHPKVTNSEPDIINQAILFFNLLGIDTSRLSAWIQLHERSIESFERVNNYWVSQTYLSEMNIRTIRIKKSCGWAKVKPFGTLHLEANSILLQLFIENLIRSTSKVMKALSNEQITYFLKGLFAAEGSVGLAKTGSVNEINFTSTRKEERTLVKLLLTKLDISSHEYDDRFEIRIFGFNNLKKLKDADIFEYHPERKSKLENGFDKLNFRLKVI